MLRFLSFILCFYFLSENIITSFYSFPSFSPNPLALSKSIISSSTKFSYWKKRIEKVFKKKKSNNWEYHVFTTPRLCFDWFTGFCSFVSPSPPEDLYNIITCTLCLRQLRSIYTKWLSYQLLILSDKAVCVAQTVWFLGSKITPWLHFTSGELWPGQRHCKKKKKKKISPGELRWASGGHMFHLKAGWPGFFVKEPVHRSKEKSEADSRDTHEASDDKHPPYGQNDSHRLPARETDTLSMKCTVYFLVQWFQFKLNVSRQTRN